MCAKEETVKRLKALENFDVSGDHRDRYHCAAMNVAEVIRCMSRTMKTRHSLLLLLASAALAPADELAGRPLMRSNFPTFMLRVTLLSFVAALCSACAFAQTEIARTPDALLLGAPEKPAAIYRLTPPPNSGLPVEAGGYFHPLRTPSGVVVTDFAPSDHKHHRGVFLAWVEMHGAVDADFWGWGAHAPIKDRRIVNRRVVLEPAGGFTATNEWLAGETVVLVEKLTAMPRFSAEMNVLDLTYELTPQADVTLARWAFSGFCLRVRKDGDIRISSPAREVALPNPNHLKPESDWPDAPWYAAEQKLPDGKFIGAAVLNHPANPPTLWHNHRDVRMLNPCIVAPGEVKLSSGQALVLRYRVVTFDGALPVEKINALAKEWK